MRTYIGIAIGMFGISIMQLVLATAMPLVVSEIGGDALYGWVFSIYMLASLFTIPVFSKLADLYGKRTFYLLGLALFGCGTLLGGLAPGMELLLAARAVQGLGAGMMTPVSLALISDLFPAAKRANMIGIFGFIQLLANLVSPFAGSFVTRNLGWHWIFYLTLAMVAVAWLCVVSERQVQAARQPARWRDVDLLGGLGFGAFCVLTVLLSQTLSRLQGSGAAVLVLAAGVAVSGVLLAWNEVRHKDPVIKIAFFRTPILRRSIVSAVISGGAMYGLVTLLPLCSVALARQGAGGDESQALSVFMIGITVGLLLGSRLVARMGTALPRMLWAVSVLVAMAAYLFLTMPSAAAFGLTTVLIGLSLGGIMATVLINSQNAVSSQDRTVLSGLVQLGRYLGAAVGVTVLTGMLPDVGQISSTSQFLAPFGLLVGMYAVGLVNELV